MFAKKHDIATFHGLLKEATSSVDRDYFLLPVARSGGGDPLRAYRERVYSYELYHQLRQRWAGRLAGYTLSGEVDKEGHMIVRGPDLDRAKPDLLVHEPGSMKRNLLALEIKPTETAKGKIEKDLRKLLALQRIENGYEASILLCFGPGIDRIRGYSAQFRREKVNLDNIALYHHGVPGQPAVQVDW
jgi:hypothetical protein